MVTKVRTVHIHISGIVQGVGFRPFVYGVATRLGLNGWVNNTSAGVDIEIQGINNNIEKFIAAIKNEKPPLAQINEFIASDLENSNTYTTFEIHASTSIRGAFQPIPPDVAICADCKNELFDPSDRRYLYPFINCTNCGPRFTIIKGIPYDRPKTTMADFPMCNECSIEYKNPLDRRFHAQPVACSTCGPHVWLEGKAIQGNIKNLTAILQTRRLLKEGYIIAIKGLGGFHLACDANNPTTVKRLRERKGRQGKPFAIMAANLEYIDRLCFITPSEKLLLCGSEKPIMLLDKHLDAPLAQEVSPDVNTLGVMLPYTPLHLLLLDQKDPILSTEPSPPILVMTSGNITEEPIAINNQEAIEFLADLADAFLLHNREIYIRCDDSVILVDNNPISISGVNNIFFFRRSRGYAPYPINLPFKTLPTLAVGAELKNTFCLTREKYAFLSHHIGDMENVETYNSFEQGIKHLEQLFHITPIIYASDLHPNYFSTKWVFNHADSPPVQVQHHHAHIASCMAENGLENQHVIGLAYDGTGYGDDGAIWGGEVLLADYFRYQRLAHLEYMPLPGGDSAIRHPWRLAVSYATALDLDISGLPFLENIQPNNITLVRQIVEKKINTPLTSSMGRLFDAVASLIGLQNDITYEAQAAIKLETISCQEINSASPYPYTISSNGGCYIIGLKSLLEAIIKSACYNEPTYLIGARFHKTIADISVQVCCKIRERIGLDKVALSGGVWQNQLLFRLTRSMLTENGFTVYSHRQTPTNDGGLALGQAAVANYIYSKK